MWIDIQSRLWAQSRRAWQSAQMSPAQPCHPPPVPDFLESCSEIPRFRDSGFPECPMPGIPKCGFVEIRNSGESDVSSGVPENQAFGAKRFEGASRRTLTECFVGKVSLDGTSNVFSSCSERYLQNSRFVACGRSRKARFLDVPAILHQIPPHLTQVQTCPGPKPEPHDLDLIMYLYLFCIFCNAFSCP